MKVLLCHASIGFTALLCACDPEATLLEAEQAVQVRVPHCGSPVPDRVGNGLQAVYDALYREETGTGFQLVNQGALPGIITGRSWQRPTAVATSQWRSFGVISTSLERLNGGHEGVDIGGNRGDTVRAAGSGLVRYVLDTCVEGDTWCGNGWGNHVVIDHGDGVHTRYAHLQRVTVAASSQVAMGAPIGALGSTGLSDGPHLHFELGVHGQRFLTCAAPQNFWIDAGPVRGGVYDPRRLSFGGGGDENLQRNAIGKRCKVSAGGDAHANVRPQAGTANAPYGAVLRGNRVKIRGFLDGWASVEAVLDVAGALAAHTEVGAHIGRNAFIKADQFDLRDCIQ